VFPLLPLMFKKGHVHVTGAFSPRAEDLTAVSRALEERRLQPHIWKRYALADIAKAHVAQDANQPIGKIVLTVATEPS
jgi:NADPH:quinone reductase-like Zn-dependent oxidoreductase